MAEPAVTHRTIELGALLHDYLLGLVLIAGGSTNSQHLPVQWVHVSDLTDPTPFLTPHTVLLTTGGQFDPPLEQPEADAYVERLRSVGTTALGVAIGVQWDRIPPTLIEACDRQQLPLLRVPYDTPFIAIVRTAARLIDAQAHAYDVLGRELAGSPSVLAKRHNLAAAEQSLRTAILTLLRSGHRDLADDIATAILPRLPRGQVVTFSVPLPLTGGLQRELLPLVTERASSFSATRDDRLVIVCEHEAAGGVRRVLSRHDCAAGVSERGSMSDLDELLAQADRAAELAAGEDRPSPLTYRPEMHAGVLQVLQQSPEALRRAQGLLAPLRAHDERNQDELSRSLAIWLAHHGQTSAAANALGVHRHTLRHRVQTAEALLRRDLDDPTTRAELWTALQLIGSAHPGR